MTLKSYLQPNPLLGGSDPRIEQHAKCFTWIQMQHIQNGSHLFLPKALPSVCPNFQVRSLGVILNSPYPPTTILIANGCKVLSTLPPKKKASFMTYLLKESTNCSLASHLTLDKSYVEIRIMWFSICSSSITSIHWMKTLDLGRVNPAAVKGAKCQADFFFQYLCWTDEIFSNYNHLELCIFELL